MQTWLVRVWLQDDPENAFSLARAAQTAMTGDDDNASRRWMLPLALAQREGAAAQAASGQGAEAAQTARRALATWVSVGKPVPASFQTWLQRDLTLARD